MNDLDGALSRLAGDGQPLAGLRGPDLRNVRHRARRRRTSQILGSGLAVLAVVTAAITLPTALGNKTSQAPAPPASAATSWPSQPVAASHEPTDLSGSIYPPPKSFPAWGLGGGCPATAGLETVTKADAAALIVAANRLGKNSDSDYRGSDRAYWPVIGNRWFPSSPGPTPNLGPSLTSHNTRISAASQSDVASLLVANCGKSVVEHSRALISCPATCTAGSSSLNGTSIWLRRKGVWLLWFQR